MTIDEAQPQAQQHKVLLLDDERLVRFTIGSYLKSAGYAVTAAASPDEAIGYIRRETFHAIISDVVMGEVDGFMFRDMLRKFDQNVPVLFLTSMLNDGGNSFLERLMEDLHSYYVSKSAPRNVLIAKLEQVISSHLAELNVRQMQARLSKSLSLASLVQKAMLPTWTHLGQHYAYASCWEPLNEVSGDLFEWYPISDDAALFVIGDLSGHGANAALAMTAIQAFLKQYAYLEDKKARQVHKIAMQLHEFLNANLSDIAYMALTVFYLNTQERLLRYLNCGNPEPLCVNTVTGEILDRNPEKKGSIPPGLISTAEYSDDEVVEFHYDANEVCMVFSDGISDVSQDKEGNISPAPEDIREICSVAATRNPGDSVMLCDLPYRVMQALYSMGYTQKQDDMSFFVLGTLEPRPGEYAAEIRMQPHPIDDAAHEASLWVEKQTGNTDLAVKMDLLLNEHLMNIYRHGFNDFARQHEVAILTITQAPHHLVLTIWDRGAPWKTVMQASQDEADAVLDIQNANLAGNGRGTPILQKLSESINSERFMNLNRTIFHVRTDN